MTNIKPLRIAGQPHFTTKLLLGLGRIVALFGLASIGWSVLPANGDMMSLPGQADQALQALDDLPNSP